MASKAPFADCSRCPLEPQPFCPPSGEDGSKIIFVGEAPGANEVLKKEPFIGRSGRLLRGTIEQEAQGELPSIWITNTVLCRPPGNRAPVHEEVLCCSKRLEGELERNPDAVIIPVGASATESIMGARMPGKITSARGCWYEINGRWIMPTYHPSYVLRAPKYATTFIKDIRKALRGPEEQMRFQEPPEYIVIKNYEELVETLEGFHDEWFSFDYETSQNHFVFDVSMMLGLYCKGHPAIIIPGDHPEAPVDLLHDPRTPGVLNRFWVRNHFVGHNAKFDIHFGFKDGITEMRVDFDTMLAHYALDEQKGTHGLKTLAREYYNVRDFDEDIKRYLPKRSADWRDIPFDFLCSYLAWDCTITLELKDDMERELKEQGLYDRCFRFPIMVHHELALEMEENGMRVDKEYLDMAQEQLETEADHYLWEMRDMAEDENFNPRSFKQVGDVLYDKLGVPLPNLRKINLQKGGTAKLNPRSTSKLALSEYAILGEKDEIIGYKHPFMDLLFKYRRVHKILSSYINNLQQYVGPDSRVHPFVFIHGTETGRISIRNPALQTIPRSSTDRYGQLIRAAFIPEDGYVFIDADYSQAEIRAWAALNGDPFLIDIYENDQDLHTMVATAMFGEDHTKEHRMIVKKFNFAYIYGGGFSVLVDSEIPQKEAAEFMERYNKNLSTVSLWRREQEKFMREHGYIESPFGRRRRYPIVTEQNKHDAVHAAYNMPVQSAASDITLLSAHRLMKMGYKVVMCIHDSVIVEVPIEDAEHCRVEVAKVMEDVASEHFPNVKWKADAEVKERWAEPPL